MENVIDFNDIPQFFSVIDKGIRVRTSRPVPKKQMKSMTYAAEVRWPIYAEWPCYDKRIAVVLNHSFKDRVKSKILKDSCNDNAPILMGGSN